MDKEDKKKAQLQKVTKKVLIIFLIVIFIFTLLSKVANSVTIPTVTVEKVKKGFLSHEVKGEGKVVADKEDLIMMPKGLKVIGFEVRNGKNVKFGDPIVTFEEASVEEAIVATYQELLACQKNYHEEKMEYEGILSKEGLSEAYAVAKEAKATLEEAKEDLSKAQLKYDNKLATLKSELKETQLADYEKVTEEKEDAREDYDECQERYDKKVSDAEETLQNVATTGDNSIRDAERELEMAKLDYDQYVKDYNRINDAFTAYVELVKSNKTDTNSERRNRMLLEFFGPSDFEIVFYNQGGEDFNAYQQLLSTYNKINTAALEYQSAVSNRVSASSPDVAASIDLKIEQSYQKLYDLVVKPSAVDEVMVRMKQLRVTTGEETLEEVKSEQKKLMSNAQDTYTQTLKKIQEELEATRLAYEKAVKNYDKTMAKVYTDADSEDNLLTTLELAKKTQEEALKVYEKAEISLTKEEKEALSSESLLATSEGLLEAKKFEIEKLTDTIKSLELIKEQGGALLSPVAGEVTECNLTKYAVTTGEERIIVGSKGCKIVGTFSGDKKEYMTEGEAIMCSINGVQWPIGATVTNVYLDNGGTVACVEADLDPVTIPPAIGASVNFELIDSEQSCENCINITALREDTQGYYVLVPQEVNSILGDVVKAYRVNVELVDKDSKIAVIEGAISKGENVIVSSSKMIMAGSVIRIED